MRISEIKNRLDANLDALVQSGFDLGWNSVIEEIEQEADRQWNQNNKTTSEVIRKLIRTLREGEDA